MWCELLKARILFVDNEPNLIEGLRRLLHKHRNEWSMSFALSGKEALDKMAESPFDVIVTEIQMPGMDGARLLQHVMDKYPNTTRIVFSGDTDQQCSYLAVRLAHQFLSKPTDADTFIQTVSRACMMRELISDETIRTLATRCNALPSPPDLYNKLQEISQADCDIKAIAEIVACDVAMSAKLLQLVNSSFFGISRRVSSIHQTVAMLGLVRIKALLLSEYILQQFKSADRIPGFSINGLWRHSFLTAEVARQISLCENQKGDRPDQAFTAGLLHDIGILILASQYPGGFRKIMQESRQSSVPVSVYEEQMFGATHAEIGSYLLGLWGLPPRIAEGVSLHHYPNRTTYDGVCALTATHVADALVSQIGPVESEIHGYPSVTMLDKAYLKHIGLAHRVPDWQQCASTICERQMVGQC